MGLDVRLWFYDSISVRVQEEIPDVCQNAIDKLLDSTMKDRTKHDFRQFLQQVKEMNGFPFFMCLGS